MLRRNFLAAALAASVVAPAWAAFPDRAIRMVVPYPAGGAADTIARVFSSRLAEMSGQPVVVENKAGASGMIGADAVARAPADGYTLLLTPTTQLTNVGFNIQPTYDAVRDFAPVIGVTLAPLVLAAPLGAQVSALGDLRVAAARRQLAYGSYGAGTSTHIMLDALSRQLGVPVTHVPYKGEGQIIVDMLAGQIDYGFLSLVTARELAHDGKIRLLGVVGAPQRSEFMPQLPTLTEQGIKDMDWLYGVGLYMSSRVPPERQRELRELAAGVMASPQVQERYRAMAQSPWGAPAEVLAEQMVKDAARWRAVTQTLGESKP